MGRTYRWVKLGKVVVGRVRLSRAQRSLVLIPVICLSACTIQHDSSQKEHIPPSENVASSESLESSVSSENASSVKNLTPPESISPSESITASFDSAEDPRLTRDLNGQEVDRSRAINSNISPEEMNQISDSGDRFRINSVGLEVPLGSLTSYKGVIEPVNYTSAFVVADYSPGYVDKEAGSVLVVAHALDGNGYAPGNYVFNPNTGDIATHVGDMIELGADKYRISSQAMIPKDEIPHWEELWNNEPRTLHFVTCVPHRDENFLMTATLVE